jgi:hypothetical protein
MFHQKEKKEAFIKLGAEVLSIDEEVFPISNKTMEIVMQYGVDRKALLDDFEKGVEVMLAQLKEKNAKLKASVKNEIEGLGK